MRQKGRGEQGDGKRAGKQSKKRKGPRKEKKRYKFGESQLARGFFFVPASGWYAIVFRILQFLSKKKGGRIASPRGDRNNIGIWPSFSFPNISNIGKNRGMKNVGKGRRNRVTGKKNQKGPKKRNLALWL